MRIENVRSDTRENRARIVATVTWEDCGRPTSEVYFETDEAFENDLSCNPHAFLIACAIPAMHYGEQRVFMDAEICPELKGGLTEAMSWLYYWYDKPDREMVRIEARTKCDLPTPRTPERAGFFFSGGIDSFATLCTNRLGFPLEHPWAIKDGLLVYGLELDDPQRFQHVMNSLSTIASEIGIKFIPIYTNLYLQYRAEDSKNHWNFWYYKFMGAALAAVAHALARRLTVVSIATDYDIPNHRPHGSHPLLDPNYSSWDLRIRHDGVALSRFAKTKLLTDWDVALKNLRVCNCYGLYRPDRLNCGECEKCVRTMLALLALGVLDQAQAFPRNDVTEELVRSAVKVTYVTAPYYEELRRPLAESGHHDLVRAIEDKLDRYYDREPGLRAKVRRFDHKYLNSSLTKLRSKTR
jgi:hypothetical protein